MGTRVTALDPALECYKASPLFYDCDRDTNPGTCTGEISNDPY